MSVEQAPVLGIDWAKRGWVGAVLEGDREPAILFGAELSDLIARVPQPVRWPRPGRSSAGALERAGIALPGELARPSRPIA